jgi:hypothetical protein
MRRENDARYVAGSVMLCVFGSFRFIDLLNLKGFNAMLRVLLRNCVLPTIACTIIAVGCSTLPPSSIQKTSQKEINAVFDDQKPERGTLSEYQLQDMVMDFSDLYVMELWQAFDEIRRSSVSKEIRTAAQYSKVLFGSAAMSIAAGQYPAANLLDMIVHMSLMRYAVENTGCPRYTKSKVPV